MYRIFGDWDLVLASIILVQEMLPKQLVVLVDNKIIGTSEKFTKETQGYLPAFLATMYISNTIRNRCT
jgi:hypothetical protein